MNISIIILALYIVQSTQGLPYIHLRDIIKENNDVTNSRRIGQHHHQRHLTEGRFRPMYHDLLMMVSLFCRKIPTLLSSVGVNSTLVGVEGFLF